MDNSRHGPARYTTDMDIYRNLRTGNWSIRSRGIVRGHADTVCASWAQFVVQPAGRRRAVESGQRNVHAFVRTDTLVTGNDADGTAFELPHGDTLRRVTYNPFKAATFVDAATGAPVRHADTVWMLHDGAVYVR